MRAGVLCLCYLLVLCPPRVHGQWWRLFVRKVEATVPPVATTEVPMTTAGTEPAVASTTTTAATTQVDILLTTAPVPPGETTSGKPRARKRPLKFWKSGEFVR